MNILGLYIYIYFTLKEFNIKRDIDKLRFKSRNLQISYKIIEFQNHSTY